MPGRKQAPQYTYTLSAHLYVKATAHQSPAPKAPSPCGGGLGRVDNSTNEPLSLWERGWGEGSNQLKNRNFGSSIILLTPSPTLPRCGLRPAGEGDCSIINTTP